MNDKNILLDITITEVNKDGHTIVRLTDEGSPINKYQLNTILEMMKIKYEDLTVWDTTKNLDDVILNGVRVGKNR